MEFLSKINWLFIANILINFRTKINIQKWIVSRGPLHHWSLKYLLYTICSHSYQRLLLSFQQDNHQFQLLRIVVHLLKWKFHDFYIIWFPHRSRTCCNLHTYDIFFWRFLEVAIVYIFKNKFLIVVFQHWSWASS